MISDHLKEKLAEAIKSKANIYIQCRFTHKIFYSGLEKGNYCHVIKSGKNLSVLENQWPTTLFNGKTIQRTNITVNNA